MDIASSTPQEPDNVSPQKKRSSNSDGQDTPHQLRKRRYRKWRKLVRLGAISTVYIGLFILAVVLLLVTPVIAGVMGPLYLGVTIFIVWIVYKKVLTSEDSPPLRTRVHDLLSKAVDRGGGIKTPIWRICLWALGIQCTALAIVMLGIIMLKIDHFRHPTYDIRPIGEGFVAMAQAIINIVTMQFLGMLAAYLSSLSNMFENKKQKKRS